MYHPIDTQYESRIAYRIFYKILAYFIFPLLLSIGLMGCSEQPTPYRPPTAAAQATRPPQVTPSPTAYPQPMDTPVPISTPTCTDDLTFLEDLTLPDGTVVKPGESMDKRWLVKNSGTCNWDERYRLKFISGAELGAPIDQSLYPARSGSNATIRILFTAPPEVGKYQSAWQAYSPQGQPFGDPIYLQVLVDSGTP